MASGKSSYKCSNCTSTGKSTRTDDTPVKQRSVSLSDSTRKILSPERQLISPCPVSTDSLSVQLERARLNSRTTIYMIQILVDMVGKFSEEVALLISEKFDTRKQIMDLKVPSDRRPEPSTSVGSLPPAAKSYSEVAVARWHGQHFVSASVTDISTFTVKSTTGTQLKRHRETVTRVLNSATKRGIYYEWLKERFKQVNIQQDTNSQVSA
ncbi:hypothetical protein L798_11099 [Zootermopsis nevadensis]|uniref:Uncharacterized protein n=1 Tax=Zootermopsis nevadensis TaxID=136037 RepID=A0A067R9D9_ZOONE|nr:hypothetical protein L798_11099 [Zootermopsis nevadensis]